MILHGYYRSTAAWRVRIALNLKGMAAEHRFRHLRRGEHRAPDYLALNPQGLLPALALEDGAVLTQSLAICEYLEEVQPEPPLLPGPPLARARVRGFAQAIACDIHPVQNLKVLNRVKALGHSQEEADGWAREVIAEGLAACEVLLPDAAGPSASAPRRGWPISAWCRSCSTRGGSGWRWRRCRGCWRPRRPAWHCPPSPRRRRNARRISNRLATGPGAAAHKRNDPPAGRPDAEPCRAGRGAAARPGDRPGRCSGNPAARRVAARTPHRRGAPALPRLASQGPARWSASRDLPLPNPGWWRRWPPPRRWRCFCLPAAAPAPHPPASRPAPPPARAVAEV
ncbi:maleylacetoacetate isomerase [Siccirubricoccus deserti]